MFIIHYWFTRQKVILDFSFRESNKIISQWMFNIQLKENWNRTEVPLMICLNQTSYLVCSHFFKILFSAIKLKFNRVEKKAKSSWFRFRWISSRLYSIHSIQTVSLLTQPSSISLFFSLLVVLVLNVLRQNMKKCEFLFLFTQKFYWLLSNDNKCLVWITSKIFYQIFSWILDVFILNSMIPRMNSIYISWILFNTIENLKCFGPSSFNVICHSAVLTNWIVLI